MGLFGNKPPKTHYDIYIKCNNCEATGTRPIPKGQTIKEYMKSGQAKCKKCGCKSVKRIDQHGMQVD